MDIFWLLLLSFKSTVEVLLLTHWNLENLQGGERSPLLLRGYMAIVLLSFLEEVHAVVEAQQESCVPVHIGATWLDWGVLAKGFCSTGSFSSHAMKR